MFQGHTDVLLSEGFRVLSSVYPRVRVVSFCDERPRRKFRRKIVEFVVTPTCLNPVVQVLHRYIGFEQSDTDKSHKGGSGLHEACAVLLYKQHT